MGPVRLCSLPELVAEMPDNGESDLLLSNEFLRYCSDMFSVPSRGADSGLRSFQPKHLNIVDPLKENNNLGRSVSKGNFYRIRSAFTYGARKLGRILLQPEDDIATGLCKFFFNTLDRHGDGQRPDVQIARPIRPYGASNSVLSVSETSLTAVEIVNLESKSDTNSLSRKRINGLDASAPETKCNDETEVEEGNREVSLSVLSIGNAHDEKKNALGHRAQDLASRRVEDLKAPFDSPRHSELSSLNIVSPAGIPYHAPHIYSSDSVLSNGGMINGDADLISSQKFSKDVHPGMSCDCNGNVNGCGLYGNLSPCVEGAVHGTNPLSDLSGDYENQLNSLQRGKWCYEYAFNMQALPRHPSPPPSVFHANNLRDANAIHHPLQFKQNGVPLKMGNGVFPNPAFYAVNPAMIPTMSFSLEDMPKPRGTGTYFPNMNHHPLVHRPSAVKGRNHAMMRSPRHLGRFMEAKMVDQTSPDILYTPVLGNQSGTNNVPSNVHQPFTSQEKGHHNNMNGVILEPDGFEFGSFEDQPDETNQPDRGRQGHQQRCPSSQDDMSPVSPARAPRTLKPIISRDQDRVSVESSYHLKDEDDFPPLST
ncbi:OLC1v1033531C1 [Oldenlandia corymbosa var. corymbosa]|nr:OLC1v1033531C1 [Oldenlandia corymbosa var. corymbosa]